MLALALLLTAATAAAADENHAPFFAGEGPVATRSVRVERRLQETFRVVDLDGDRVEVTAEGLPAGAALRVRDPRPWTGEDGPPNQEAKGRSREVSLTWTPSLAQRGSHAVTLVASDGRAVERLQLELKVEEEWESFFLPGVQYSAYVPAAGAQTGAFHGAAFELVLGSWIHQTDARGPSHGRITLDLALLDPARAGAAKAFAYALGLDLSVERNPWRKWLIPVFGLEVGGFHQRELGSFFFTSPFVGAHLWASRNAFVTVTGGYVFPGRDVEKLGGWRVRAGVDAVLW